MRKFNQGTGCNKIKGTVICNVQELADAINAGQITPDAIFSTVNYVLNNQTGLYDQVTHTWINGVLQPFITVATTYTIPPVKHDIEYLCDINLGVYVRIDHVTDNLNIVTDTQTITTIACVATTTTTTTTIGVPVFDGIILDILPNQQVIHSFTIPVTDISVYNDTSDFITVSITPIPQGNNNIVISPKSSQNFGSFGDNKITNVEINHINLNGFGGGRIIINGFSKS